MADRSTELTGYRRKPAWINVVGLFFIFTPFGDFLLTLASLNIPRWYKPEVWAYWVRFVPIQSWVLMAFIFGSGVALLFFVRTWALILTMVTLAAVVIYNVIMIRAFSLMGTLAVSTMILTTAVAAYFLYFSRFRRPYVNPKIRWWETSPRFRVAIPAAIESVTVAGTVVDVSETGALLEWEKPFDIPPREKVTRLTLPPDLAVNCQVARGTERGYGVNFGDNDRATRKRLKEWLKSLKRGTLKF